MAWRIGDEMRMFFFIIGETDETLLKVISIDEETVTLDEFGIDDDGNEGYRVFNRKTGKCLNDNTWGGARRYITRCSEV